MSLTKDEWRALGFVGLLLALALVAHALDQPEELVPEVESLDLEALATTADSALESLARRRKPLAPGEKIDPNTASSEDLNRRPGIGPALADRIVEERETNGPFESAADLERVRGIGPATRMKFEPFIRIER